jgi:dephospho-CoA kinase
MLKVGLTGGIGSGKSLVAGIFKQLGIPVFHADDRSKILLATSDELRRQLIGAFGPSIYNEKQINKPVFANHIFSGRKPLEIANGIIHPFVIADFELWCNQLQHIPYLIMEAAILFESGAHQNLDHTVAILASEEVRIQRVITRDQTDRESVLRRMQFQFNDDRRQKLADSLLINNDTQLLIPQVLDLHQFLLGLSGKNKIQSHG